MMHPLRAAVEAALTAGLDFLIVVGGDRDVRVRMGLPESVVDRQPLLLAFPANYHAYAMPSGDEDGLSCQLSFDALYHCRIPWSAMRQFVINYPGDDAWPEAWGGDDGESEADDGEVAGDGGDAPMDNVRQFRPRNKQG